MNQLIILLLVFSSVEFSNSKATRCYVPSPSEARQEAKMIFIGKVTGVDDPTMPATELKSRGYEYVRPIRVRFAVERVYLGSIIKEIELRTKTGGTEFGIEPKLGNRYLVYASEDQKEKGLSIGGCSRTRLLKHAKEDLEFLKRVKD